MSMPLCVDVLETGELVSTGQLSESCMGYVLMTVGDYSQSLTLGQIFAVPETSQLAMLFSFATGLVVSLALVAHLVGTVAGFFNYSSKEETL